jgi:hypothetical protein
MASNIQVSKWTKLSWTSNTQQQRKIHRILAGKSPLWSCRNRTNQPTTHPPNQHGVEKRTGPTLVKKLLACFQTQRFITMFTTSHNLTISGDNQIQFTPFQPISLRSILIPFSHQVVSFLPVPCQYLFPYGKPCAPSNYSFCDLITHPTIW